MDDGLGAGRFIVPAAVVLDDEEAACPSLSDSSGILAGKNSTLNPYMFVGNGVGSGVGAGVGFGVGAGVGAGKVGAGWK